MSDKWNGLIPGTTQMTTGLARMRELLLPGLRAMEGRYPTLGALREGYLAGRRINYRAVWGILDSTPIVSAETAARSKERARGLLKSLLSPEQWEEFERAGLVKEKIDGCEFILTPGGMIEARKPRLIGSVRECWCVAPDPRADGNNFLPAEDKLIGQLLHLRAGPDKLRAQANVFAML